MTTHNPLETAILYIVATPIGNLGDITQRALKVLSEVDLIAAEDTRHSQKLLQHLGLQTPMLSLHQFNEEACTQQMMSRLLKGMKIALISDAGTPLIADPGYRLVQQARAKGVQVVPIPGPCALITALCAAGLPTDKFSFEGFLPVKPGKRTAKLEALKHVTSTLVLYEAPHRILDLLEQLIAIFGPDRQVVVARELTKLYESYVSGPVHEVLTTFQHHKETQCGEFVVMIAGAPETPEDFDPAEAERILNLLSEELPKATAAKLTAKILKVNKNAVYQIGLGLRG